MNLEDKFKEMNMKRNCICITNKLGFHQFIVVYVAFINGIYVGIAYDLGIAVSGSNFGEIYDAILSENDRILDAISAKAADSGFPDLRSNGSRYRMEISAPYKARHSSIESAKSMMSFNDSSK